MSSPPRKGIGADLPDVETEVSQGCKQSVFNACLRLRCNSFNKGTTSCAMAS
ncbi:MAG: hypothetical protein ACK560_08340 [Bacteroidota bacterium]